MIDFEQSPALPLIKIKLSTCVSQIMLLVKFETIIEMYNKYIYIINYMQISHRVIASALICELFITSLRYPKKCD